MTGIRVTDIPDNVTDKQLHAYFSNPKNGGGPIRQMYFPLQNNGAVILFESPSVLLEIFKTRHRLVDNELKIASLPRQIYDQGIMEIEKGVSVVLSFQQAVIDELQYIGNLKVDFNYSKECYLLKGTWYQLEWALHLLDRTLDSFEGIARPTKEKKEKGAHSEESESSQGPGSPRGSPVRSTSPVKHMEGATGYTQASPEGFFEEEDLFPRATKYEADRRTHTAGKKNKNISLLPTKTGQNKNVNRPKMISEGKRDVKKDGKGRGVSFKKGAELAEVKPRPTRTGPPLTSGIDVALTGFGGKQLSFSFELTDNLKVMVLKADITKQRTDGIVSPNTPDLSNTFGVASAIARAADRRFKTECQRRVQEHGLLELTGVAHVNAGGNLNHHVGFIIHVVGPQWDEKASEASMHCLVCAYVNCFQYSEDILWLKSLSTPLISAGAYGFPLDCCIQAFFDALLIHMTHVDKSPHLQEIQLVCFDSDSAGAAIMILQSLLEVDRKQSEAAAMDRYYMGCTKYNLSAKMLKTSPDSKGMMTDEDERLPDREASGEEDNNETDEMKALEDTKAFTKQTDIDTSNKDASSSTTESKEKASGLTSVVSKNQTTAVEQKYGVRELPDTGETDMKASNETKETADERKSADKSKSSLKEDAFDERHLEVKKTEKEKILCEEEIDTGKELQHFTASRNAANQDKEKAAENAEGFDAEQKQLKEEKIESDSSETEDTGRYGRKEKDIFYSTDITIENNDVKEALDDKDFEEQEKSVELKSDMMKDNDLRQKEIKTDNKFVKSDTDKTESVTADESCNEESITEIITSKNDETTANESSQNDYIMGVKTEVITLDWENDSDISESENVAGSGLNDFKIQTEELAEMNFFEQTHEESDAREDFSESQWSILPGKQDSEDVLNIED